MKVDSTPWMVSTLIFSLALAGVLLGQSKKPSLSTAPTALKSTECEQWYRKAVDMETNPGRHDWEYTAAQVGKYTQLAIACQEVINNGLH